MANAYNQVTLVGRIPNTDKIRYEFHAATNDSGSNARMNGSISVQRNRKPEGEKYYPEDLIPFTAFGGNARFMNEYIKRGDALVIQGSLETSTQEDQNGNRRTYYSVLVDSVRGVPRNASDTSSSNNNSSRKSPSKSGGFPIDDDDTPHGGSEDTYKPFG